MTENPEYLLRTGTKKDLKSLTDLKSHYGKAELLGVWLPGGVQNPEAGVKTFCPLLGNPCGKR